ncbi:MAG: hypothetical protein WD875_12655, partial [Pirellulales bacterium]
GGAIYLTNIATALLTVGGITSESVSIVAKGSMVLDGPVAIVGSGDLRLDATGNLTLTHAVATGSGSVYLLATRDVVSTSAFVLASQGGQALVRADSDANGQGAVELGGSIDLGGGDVTIDTPAAGGRIDGVIGGEGGLIKLGGGALMIASESTNTFRGTTHVQSGTLIVNGTLGNGGAVVFAGGTLSGNGMILGSVEVLAGGKLAPGVLRIGELALHAGATVEFDVHGLSLGTDHDQLIVSRTVQLGGATIVALSGQFTAPRGATIVLIANDGEGAIAGAFVDANQQPLPQGSKFPLGGGTVDIRYDAGTGGNDLGFVFTQQTFFFTDLGQDSSGSGESGLSNGGVNAGLGAAVAAGDEPTETRRSTLAPADAEQTNLAADSAAAQTVRLGSFENLAQSRLRVFFRLYDDALEKEDNREYPLPVKDLSDVLAVFRRYKFPNGHYRVYVQEAGARVERLLLDVQVDEGKVVSEGFREEAGSPAGSSERGTRPSEPPPSAEVLPPTNDGTRQNERQSDRPNEHSPSTGLRPEIPLGAAAIVGLASGQTPRDWRKQIHDALAVGRGAMSKAARRLRKIQVSGIMP